MINFKQYDQDNPLIWNMFVAYSNKAKSKGFKNYSAKGIFELIRWHTPIKGNDQYKINNNYHADYARKMMIMYPNFEGFFRLREMKTARI